MRRMYLPPLTSRAVQAAVSAAAEVSRLPRQRLLERSNGWDKVQARSLAWLIIRIATRASYQSIGAQVGGYTHGALLHGCHLILQLMSVHPDMRRLYDRAVDKYWALMNADA